MMESNYYSVLDRIECLFGSNNIMNLYEMIYTEIKKDTFGLAWKELVSLRTSNGSN